MQNAAKGSQSLLEYGRSLVTSKGSILYWGSPQTKNFVCMSSSFCVLVCGWPSASVVSRFGGYGAQLTRLLSRSGESWSCFDVEDGREMPTDAELAKFDGIVLSGSRHGVYDEKKWIQELQDLVRRAHDRKQRMLGVCFGAQLIAQALGGKVAQSPFGWEAGARSIRVDVDKLSRRPYGSSNLSSSFRVCELHQDAIEELPVGAELLGSSPNCRHELYAVGDNILGVQGHPEFTPESCLDLVQTRIDVGVIPPAAAQVALRSLKDDPPPLPTDPDSPLRLLCQSFLSK